MGHLRDNGFEVTIRNVSDDDLMSVKQRNGVDRRLAGCHTAIVDGYVIEGHVPAKDIRRLLEEKPQIAGLAVPGMPAGAPGMEMPNGRRDPYNVLAFDRAGNVQVYSKY